MDWWDNTKLFVGVPMTNLVEPVTSLKVTLESSSTSCPILIAFTCFTLQSNSPLNDCVTPAPLSITNVFLNFKNYQERS